jgi:hypothetical protein
VTQLLEQRDELCDLLLGQEVDLQVELNLVRGVSHTVRLIIDRISGALPGSPSLFEHEQGSFGAAWTPIAANFAYSQHRGYLVRSNLMFGRPGTMPPMNRTTYRMLVVGLAALGACGGKTIETLEPDAGNGSPSSSGSTGEGSDAGTDAASACRTDGDCMFCNGYYDCPGNAPEPQCPPGATLYAQCATTCISCGSDGTQEDIYQNDAWLWTCGNGSYVAGGAILNVYCP